MWDQRYSSKEYAYGTEPNQYLEKVAQQLQPQSKILCLADGEGRNGVFLAQQGHQVTSLDQSSVGLQKALALALKHHVHIETIVANLADYTIEENHWDAIVSIFAHVPPAIRIPLHRQVVNGLKAGGTFILEAYTPAQLKYKTGGPPNAKMMMTLEQLKKELNGLSFQDGQEIEREVVEGKYHTGQAAVVQLMALKEK